MTLKLVHAFKGEAHFECSEKVATVYVKEGNFQESSESDGTGRRVDFVLNDNGLIDIGFMRTADQRRYDRPIIAEWNRRYPDSQLVAVRVNGRRFYMLAEELAEHAEAINYRLDAQIKEGRMEYVLSLNRR